MLGRIGLGLVLAGVLMFGLATGAEAHRTGAFHWHVEFTEFGMQTCLYGPSGAIVLCQ